MNVLEEIEDAEDTLLLSLSRIKDRLFYGWVIVMAGFVMHAIVAGTRYSFGIFFKSIESEFDLTRAATSGVFSAYMVIGCAFTITGGWALDRYGPRIVIFLMGLFTGLSLLLTSQVSASWQLFISYSLLLAMGTGPGYTVLMATVSRWFDRRRGLALGIAGSGVGLGIVVMAPFATYLIYNLDWRSAYIMMGLIAGLVSIFLSILFRKDPREIGVFPDGVEADSGEMAVQDKKDNAQLVSLSLPQAFRTSSFWFLVIVWLSYSLCLHLVLTHIVPHATDVGISATEAAVVLALTSGASIPGTFVMGGVSDRIGRKVSFVICSLLQAGATVSLIWSQDLWMFYLVAVFVGFSWGGLSTTLTALIGDVFGLRSLGVIMGALVVGWGIGGAIGPLIGGFIFDVSNHYSLAFLAGAVAMLVATLFVALIRPETNRNV